MANGKFKTKYECVNIDKVSLFPHADCRSILNIAAIDFEDFVYYVVSKNARSMSAR